MKAKAKCTISIERNGKEIMAPIDFDEWVERMRRKSFATGKKKAKHPKVTK